MDQVRYLHNLVQGMLWVGVVEMILAMVYITISKKKNDYRKDDHNKDDPKK